MTLHSVVGGVSSVAPLMVAMDALWQYPPFATINVLPSGAVTSVCPTIDRACLGCQSTGLTETHGPFHNVMVTMSNDLIGELTTQIYDDMGMRAADATVLVAALYEFLIQQSLASRKDVHDHLKARGEAMTGSERFVRLRKQLDAMADLFRDGAPQDPRARLQLIQGGLSKPRGR